VVEISHLPGKYNDCAGYTKLYAFFGYDGAAELRWPCIAAAPHLLSDIELWLTEPLK